jgi:hypothetical protein
VKSEPRSPTRDARNVARSPRSLGEHPHDSSTLEYRPTARQCRPPIPFDENLSTPPKDEAKDALEHVTLDEEVTVAGQHSRGDGAVDKADVVGDNDHGAFAWNTLPPTNLCLPVHGRKKSPNRMAEDRTESVGGPKCVSRAQLEAPLARSMIAETTSSTVR